MALGPPVPDLKTNWSHSTPGPSGPGLENQLVPSDFGTIWSLSLGPTEPGSGIKCSLTLRPTGPWLWDPLLGLENLLVLPSSEIFWSLTLKSTDPLPWDPLVLHSKTNWSLTLKSTGCWLWEPLVPDSRTNWSPLTPDHLVPTSETHWSRTGGPTGLF